MSFSPNPHGLSPILARTIALMPEPIRFDQYQPSMSPDAMHPPAIPGSVSDMQSYYGHQSDMQSEIDYYDPPPHASNTPPPPAPLSSELVRARVSSDRVVSANEKTQRNGDFTNPRDWRVYLTERNELFLTIPVIIDFSNDEGQAEDCAWWASLEPIAPPHRTPAAATPTALTAAAALQEGDGSPQGATASSSGPQARANGAAAGLDQVEPLVDQGMISATKQREILLSMSFILPKEYVSRRNLKCRLDVTVNEVEVTGLPVSIQVRCSRQERRDEGKKRASDTASIDSQEQPGSKRARRAAPATAAAAAAAAAGAASIASAGAAAALDTRVLTPPQLTGQPPRFAGRPVATAREEAKLLALISDPFLFNQGVVGLLSLTHIRDAVARQAFELLLKIHLGPMGTAWTCAQVVQVLELIGGYAEVLLPTSWQETPINYPSPMHLLAKCERPDLVHAVFTFLAPPLDSQQPSSPCDVLHIGRDLMACATCRTNATFRALAHTDSPYLPIHTAARYTNTVFFRHHLRILGAQRTLLVPNDRDRGNVFHTVCGAMSAADWLEEVWGSVLVGDDVRRVVIQALGMKNSYGATPLDMARFQVEQRGGGAAQINTYDWVAHKLGLPQWPRTRSA